MSDHVLLDQCAKCPGAVKYRVEVAVMYKCHTWCLVPCTVNAGPNTPRALIGEEAVKYLMEQSSTATAPAPIDFMSVRFIELVA